MAATLVLPPASLLVLAALGQGLRVRFPALGKVVTLGALLALYALSTPLVGRSLLRSLEDARPAQLAPASAQAIVVLGADVNVAAPEYGGSSVGPLSLERVRYAAQLQRRMGLPVLVTGGRLNEEDAPVSVLMERALHSDFAIPVRWVEDRSRNTMENARLSAAILRGAGITKVMVVTHAWHMPRALYAFATAGLDAIPAPTGYTSPAQGIAALAPDAKALSMSAYAVHELVGLLWYRLHY